MADITQNLTHVEDAKKRLLTQYKELPNIEGLISIFSNQIQDLEDVTFSIVDGRTLANGIGEQLDLLGTIVGLTRESGLSDARYRTLLYVKIGQNTSQGAAEKIISIIKLLTDATRVFYQNLNDASLLLAIDTNIDPNDDADEVAFVYNNMQNVVMGGVRIDYIVCYSPDDDAFAFAGSNANAPALGFGTVTDSNIGGKLAKTHRLRTPFAFDGQNQSTGGFGSIRDVLMGGTFVGT